MNTILKWSGVVALVILAIMGLSMLLSGGESVTFGTACDQITCIDGGLRITNGPLESTGNVVDSGNLTVSGTSALAGTTTLAAGFIMTKAPSCLQFQPTSTVTTVKMTFAATSTASSATNTGVIPVVAYGTCN